MVSERSAGRRARARLPCERHGCADRIGPPQGDRRQTAAARGVVQAGAARADDDRRAQRRGQDDAAADAGGGAVDRQGRAEPAEGRPRGAPRPAPAARARGWRCASTCCRAACRSWPRSAELAELERRMGEGADTEETTARPLRPGAGAAGGAGGLPVARPRDRDDARAGVCGGGPGAPAGHLLRRAADARLAGAGAGDERGRAAAGRAHQPPRHRVAGVAGADADGPRRGDRAGRPRPLVPGGRRHRRARAGGGPLALLRRQLAQLAPRAGRARDGAWARRSTSSRRRSRAWSASSSASATRRRRPNRRSRA